MFTVLIYRVSSIEAFKYWGLPFGGSAYVKVLTFFNGLFASYREVKREP